MPLFKWTGSNDAGFVVMGGIRFEPGAAMEVKDPHQASKLEGHPEFELVGQPTEPPAPVWNPPGPTVMGTGPGSGPYQTTAEVVDANPQVPEPPPDQSEGSSDQSEPPPEPGPETEPFAAEATTDEGPKKPKRK